jgi:2-polyprenyl-3-methyl-5-hydroxy-6-metoxy-1,4-benzoquinol methylase
MSEEFLELRNLLVSSEWPESVLEFQIVDENSEQEKMDRAEGVIDILIQEELKNKKFLDFGCGEGHMTKYAASQCLTSIGYDIEKSSNQNFIWEDKQDNFLLTTDFEKIKENGPYDIILIYDVIDHSENPVEVLKQASSVLSDGGKIYLRCHPWCSRHGGHLYRQINKAFAHVIFTEEEIKNLGYKTDDSIRTKILYPIMAYKQIIEKSELKQNEPEFERQNIEDFFEKNEIVSNRIKKAVPVGNSEFPRFQLSICFLDYILTK